jgi:hypothetical protein
MSGLPTFLFAVELIYQVNSETQAREGIWFS